MLQAKKGTASEILKSVSKSTNAITHDMTPEQDPIFPRFSTD